MALPGYLNRLSFEKLFNVLEYTKCLAIVALVHFVAVLKGITLQSALCLLCDRNRIDHLLSRVVDDSPRIIVFFGGQPVLQCIYVHTDAIGQLATVFQAFYLAD